MRSAASVPTKSFERITEQLAVAVVGTARELDAPAPPPSRAPLRCRAREVPPRSALGAAPIPTAGKPDLRRLRLTPTPRNAQSHLRPMDLETEAAQRVGTTLCNKWTLERLIGTGGMAAVYVANHKIGRREAIKILHSDVARDPELRARFEQEASAVNHFKHPGAVDVRDIDVAEDGAPFLVMELLDGQPLAALARQPGGVPLGELLRMVDEMLDVLVAAHAQGIIHRDIKPDNLFVLQDGRLKVLDFGIARVRAGAPPKLSTRVGATLGTAPYMPPEQIRGVEIDARADIFAVGATLFRLIARRRIHEAVSEADTLVKMASAQAPSLTSVAPDTPRDVCLVVDRALMFDREKRYPDALTMQRDVRALREGQPPALRHEPCACAGCRARRADPHHGGRFGARRRARRRGREPSGRHRGRAHDGRLAGRAPRGSGGHSAGFAPRACGLVGRGHAAASRRAGGPRGDRPAEAR